MRDYVGIANQYIDDVLSGEVVACQFVTLACERQRRDLALENFAYTFDEDLASYVCKFVELLPHVKGVWARKRELITLEPWQIFILTTVFGWIDADGLRRFKTVYTEIPRKNGKSAISSGVGLYMLAADGEAGAEVYSAATTRDQAKIVWDVAKSMAEKTKGLQQRFGVNTSSHSIFVEHNNSVFKPLSRDQGGNHDGYSVSCGIIDELHAHNTRDIFDVIETGTGSRDQPLLWLITTAGTNRAGICYEQRGYLVKILNGGHVDNEYFGIIFTIDDGDDWTDPTVWEKANPNWGKSVKPDDIARKARKAMETPSAVNNFLTKHLNVWCNAATAWMDMRVWDGCAERLSMDDFKDYECYMGLDLAEKRDIAALSILFRRDNTVYSFGKYYLNEERVEQSGNSQFSGWQKSGHLIVNDGNITDFDLIANDIKEICNTFSVKAVAYDPAKSQYFAVKLFGDGIPMVQFVQSARNYTTPFIELENLVYGDEFRFDGNPALTWMISNVMAKTSQFSGLVHPVKEGEENKIDGAMALLMALGEMMDEAEDQQSVYEDRGIRSL